MASLRGGMRAGGERLGVLPALPLEVIRRIIAERAKGLIFQAIADGLMEGRIVTSRGRPTWYPATIKAGSFRAIMPPSSSARSSR